MSLLSMYVRSLQALDQNCEDTAKIVECLKDSLEIYPDVKHIEQYILTDLYIKYGIHRQQEIDNE